VAGLVQANTLRASEKASNPLLELTFEKTQGDWLAFGGAAQVRVATEAANVKNGKGVLAVDYQIARGQFGLAVLPISEGTLAGTKQLTFWLKTDSSAPVSVILNERKSSGGNYMTTLWSPKDTWQQIELVPEDFAPTESPTDPVDPNHKLDMDQVESLSLLDLGQFYAMSDAAAEIPVVLDKRLGAHSLYIDDFKALADAPSMPPAGGKGVVIDDFHRGFVSWMTMGGAAISLDVSGNPLAGRAVKADYEQIQGRMVLLSYAFPRVDLRGIDRLTFDVAATTHTQFLVAVQLKNPGKSEGPRFNTSIDIPGGTQLQHQEIILANLNFDPKSPAAPGGKLDPALIRSIALIDVTAAYGGAQQKNTLWIANLRAEGSK
jgi:hypothetical protein